MSGHDESHLADIVARLDADERYDVSPSGNPPVSTAQYRRIVRAVVFLKAAEPPGQIARTPEEAYLDGQRQVTGEIQRIVGVMLNVPPS